MMLVEKAKTERIKDHKIISLTLKQGSEMNNLFIISISFFPGIYHKPSSETQGQLVGSINFHHEHFIDPTNCPWVSEDYHKPIL